MRGKKGTWKNFTHHSSVTDSCWKLNATSTINNSNIYAHEARACERIAVCVCMGWADEIRKNLHSISSVVTEFVAICDGSFISQGNRHLCVDIPIARNEPHIVRTKNRHFHSFGKDDDDDDDKKKFLPVIFCYS